MIVEGLSLSVTCKLGAAKVAGYKGGTEDLEGFEISAGYQLNKLVFEEEETQAVCRLMEKGIDAALESSMRKFDTRVRLREIDAREQQKDNCCCNK